MTIQKAAHRILEEIGKPLNSRELAQIALERSMVGSSAKDPVQSLSQTIEKNIRDGIYNSPNLKFILGSHGRTIGLPSWEANTTSPEATPTLSLTELKVRIPIEVFEKIKLAEQAKLKNTFDETVAILLIKGLSSVASDIKKGLLQQLDTLDTL